MAPPQVIDDPVRLLAEKLQRALEERARLLTTQRRIFGEGRVLARQSSTLVDECRIAREARQWAAFAPRADEASE